MGNSRSYVGPPLHAVNPSWEILPLEGICEGIYDCPHSTPKLADHGYYMVRTQDIRKGYFETSDAVFVSEESYKNRIRRVEPSEGDVLLSREGTYFGDAAEVPPDTNLCLGQRMVLLRPRASIISARFLRIWINSPSFQNFLLAFRDGTVAERLNLSTIRKLPIPLPSIKEQERIEAILSPIENKIELNRKMNATLEAMAQALFKSWFVDFDPVIDNALAAGNPIPEELAERAEIRRQNRVEADKRSAEPNSEFSTKHSAFHYLFPSSFTMTDELGWIPEGWEVTTLSELLEVKYGKDHKKLADGKFPVYGSGGLMRHVESALYKGESVLIPRKGTLSNILYLNEEFWTVDTMFYTIPKTGSVAKFCYYHVKGLDFTSMNVGSAVPSMTTKVLNNLPIVKPSNNVLDKFDALISAYFRKSEQNNKESQTLTKLRDILLPKLISGELDSSTLAGDAHLETEAI